MKRLPKILSLLALAGTIVPATLFMLHLLGESSMKALMLAAAVLWFAASPFWLKGGGD